MTPRDLQALIQLAALEHREKSRAVQALQAEEARLRAQIVSIEAARGAEAAEPDADLARQRIGADIAWQALQDRRRREVQMELARVLARREPLMAALRRSFGRERVAEALLDRAKAAERQGRARRDGGV